MQVLAYFTWEEQNLTLIIYFDFVLIDYFTTSFVLEYSTLTLCAVRPAAERKAVFAW